jgi:hypothetical protein
MGQNEKIRTEDIIEILDNKILATEGHPAIGVLPLEPYDSVITKISNQILSPNQKAAFDATLTAPSASNPVVLKNDITTYIPQADLGSIKDSVDLFSELPLPFTANASTVLGSNLVTINSTTGVIESGALVTGAEFSINTIVVTIISPTEVQIIPAAILTASNVTITFSPVEGDLRGVITDGIIYRWNGSAWVAFTRTGTLQHPELLNQNGDPNYQHITQTQENSLISNSHSHANKTILDGILSVGSGAIITTAERALLPTTDQKDALVGTSGTPSASNPYLTNSDPRLNTTRNPYVTIGPPGSLATFEGVDFRPFNDAILAITLGSASTVKAIEVLAGFYNLSGVSIIWSTEASSLLLEGFTPNTATLSFQTRAPGIQALSTGNPLIIRGFIFELNDQGTSGILSTRENTLIEDCIFMPGPTTSLNQLGITLQGAGSIVRRCQFLGELNTGVRIQAPNCRVESCTFNLALPTSYAVDCYAGADSSLIDHCFMTSGLVRVQSGVNYVNITNNRFAAVTNTITDLGTSTRYLENQPEEVNQPFIGRKRTVGPLGTYADYRGSDETPFVNAFADPNVTEVEVLEGTYTFAHTLSVPLGYTLRGVSDGSSDVILQGAAGVQVLDLSSFSRIENIQIRGSNTNLIVAVGASNINIEHCTFNLTATNASSQYEVALGTPLDCMIKNCFFTGQRGVRLYGGSTRTRLLSSVFTNVISSLVMDTSITNQKDHIKDNHFITAMAPAISGNILLIENNHFLGALPTKLNTTSSIWQGNWPYPQSDNDTGVDSIVISLDKYLEPTSTGVERSTLASTGTISFIQNGVGIASTLPIALNTRLDKTKPYSVTLYWTSANGITGSVAWQITVVFRDRITQTIGSYVSSSIIVPRTQLLATEEDAFTLTYTSYGLATDPTHISLIIERVGTDPLDTLLGNAHLTEVQVTLPRD